MGKKAEQNRVVRQEGGLALEQTAIYDDNLLPSADELAKLQELDPNCIEWIKKRTEIEQDARIKFNMDKISLMKKDMNHTLFQNVLCILAAFFIIVLVIGFSAYFIYKGLAVQGTVFGGTSIILAAMIFIRWREKPPKDK